MPLRELLAAQPQLAAPVLQVVPRVVTRHLLDGAQLAVEEGHGGAVTLTMVSTDFWRMLMHPNRASRRVHSSGFKARVLAECRQPGAFVSAVAIAHGLNANVVRKWLAGRGLKRMVAAAAGTASSLAPALQFVPIELASPAPVVAPHAAPPDIRIELQRGGPHVKLQCAAGAGSMYAARLRALADALAAEEPRP